MYNNRKPWNKGNSPRKENSENSERRTSSRPFDKKSYRSFDRKERTDDDGQEKRGRRERTFSPRAKEDSFSSSPRRFDKSRTRDENSPRQKSRYGESSSNERKFSPRGKDNFYDKKVSRKSFSDGYDPNDKYSKKKRDEFRKNEVCTEMRLNRFLANAGICSRREADDFIQAGVVSVNGKIVSELGTKVQMTDVVKFHDQTIKVENKVYILLNKPKDCVTTADDPQGRMSVLDLVKDACTQRIYPVGRLDKNTTGVLLLTNDGELTSKLTHPKYDKKKIYHAFLDKPLAEEDLQKILSGIELEDGEIHADAAEYVSEDDARQVGIEIHSGRNRIVRRIFEHLGYDVQKLDRVYFAGLTKKNLQRGHYRFLTKKEIQMLQMGAYE